MKATTSLLSQLWQNSIFKFVIIVLIFAAVALVFVLVRKSMAKVKRKKLPDVNTESKFQIVDDIMAMDSDHIIE